jgi:hypothetical protein
VDLWAERRLRATRKPPTPLSATLKISSAQGHIKAAGSNIPRAKDEASEKIVRRAQVDQTTDPNMAPSESPFAIYCAESHEKDLSGFMW